MKISRRKGYTLLEVLAVVIILMVLTYVSVPLYNRIINRADVSDALYKMEMFTSAQEKFFIANKRYTKNLEELNTPLKGGNGEISTAQFTYYAGDPQEDDYCIYSQSNSKNYTLAKNYKTNSDIVCVGSDCNKIKAFVNEGGIADLCAGQLGEEECPMNQVLGPNGCGCDTNINGEAGIYPVGTRCDSGDFYALTSNCSCECSEDLLRAGCTENGWDLNNCSCNAGEGPSVVSCNPPKIWGNGTCGCQISGGDNPPYLFGDNGDPDRNKSGIVPVKTPCSMYYDLQDVNYTITENCTCECNIDAQLRDCVGGMRYNQNPSCGSCGFGGACGYIADWGDAPNMTCEEGYVNLDGCFCEPIVECPSGQTQVPSPSSYEIIARCGCLITTDSAPYVWSNSGRKVGGYFPPGTTHCSNDPNVFSVTGTLTEDCRCVGASSGGGIEDL